MHSEPGDIERNLDRTQSFVFEAAENRVDLVCFPELSLTGYTLKNTADLCTSRDWSHAVNRIVSMAQQADLIIIAGLAEPSNGTLPYITQLVAGPDGLLGIHRKTHLSPHENNIYKAGQEIEVILCGQNKLGIQLCYEVHFPEVSTIMSIKGADIIIVPHASPRGSPEQKLRSWLRHLTARAFDNGVFLVACNQVGETLEGYSFPGISLVLGPDGMVLDQYTGGKEHILYSKLTNALLKEVRQNKMKYFFPMRRPELYKDIAGTSTGFTEKDPEEVPL